MTVDKITTMLAKRQTSSIVSVPQNFIPGLTKPRLSVEPEPKPDKIERKPTSVCYHGVRVRIPEDAGLVERIALRGGIIGLSLPTPSMHLDCTEKGVPLVAHFEDEVSKSDRTTCSYNENGFIALPEKIKLMEHRKAHRCMTAPSQFSLETNASQDFFRTKTLPAKDLGEKRPASARTSYATKLGQIIRLDNFVSSVSESKKSEPRKTSMCTSLPDIVVDSDVGDILGAGRVGSDRRLPRSVSCDLDKSEEHRPNSRAAKRKYSRELLRKSQNLKENERKNQEKKEREMYGALQDVMRSKLPKTFLATAKMFNPVIAGPAHGKPAVAKKASKAKSEYNIKRKRAGSLPALLFNRFSHHAAEEACSSGAPPVTRPTRSSIAVPSKIEKLTGSPKLGHSLLCGNPVSKEKGRQDLAQCEAPAVSDETSFRPHLDGGLNWDSASSTDSGIMIRNLSGDEQDAHASPKSSVDECPSGCKSPAAYEVCVSTDGVARESAPTACKMNEEKGFLIQSSDAIPVAPNNMDQSQGHDLSDVVNAQNSDSDISSVKVQDSARKRKTSYQVNIKVAEDKKSVKYKLISSSSIKIRTQSLRSGTKKASEEIFKSGLETNPKKLDPPARIEVQDSDVPRKTSQRERPKLVRTKLPAADLLLPLPAPVISKLHVVQPVCVHSAKTTPTCKLQRPNREEIKAILESFKTDLFDRLPKASLLESPPGSHSLPSNSDAGGRIPRKVVKAPRWKGSLVVTEAPHLELAVHDNASLSMSAKVTCDPVHIAKPVDVIQRKASFSRTKMERSASNMAEYITNAMLVQSAQEDNVGYERTKSEPVGETDALQSLNAMLVELEVFSRGYSCQDGVNLGRIPYC